MAWDTSKADGDQLTSSEWNTHVTDQKTRAVRGMTLVATALVFADATEQLLTSDAAELIWDNTNKRLGIGTASPGTTLQVGTTTGQGIITVDGAANAGAGIFFNEAGVLKAQITMVAGTTYFDYFGNLKFRIGKDGTEGIIFSTTTGNAWFIGDVSALTFTDRTPFYEGDALVELKRVKGKDSIFDIGV